MKKKVFVGMSGGVDSSVAAAILLEQGYDVEGVTMLLSPNIPSFDSDKQPQFVADAKRVCDCLGIRLHVINMQKEFYNGVISPFAHEYMEGRTPNPCVMCNPYIKFGKMLDYALENGADYIATGHYALIENGENGEYLLKKSPSRKDQSYFLCGLNQQQLAHAMFPLGDMDKEAVRAFAMEKNLPVASKSDSQEICFIPDDNYVAFIEENFDYNPQQGNFINENGNILGHHKGIIHYTVGQRKGLGMAFGEPMYVKFIDAVSNTITLATAENRFSSELEAVDFNWITKKPPTERFFAQVKVRSTAKAADAQIILSAESLKIIFKQPQICVSPGQAAVLYDGNFVLGGGRIL